jgi:hypothetical protein
MRSVSVARIAGALSGVILAAGLAFLAVFWRELKQVGVRTPEIEAGILIQAVAHWRLSRGPAACPTLADLRDALLLEPREPLPTDPWHHQYIIECAGESVAVRAPGPDGKANTLDDLLMTH